MVYDSIPTPANQAAKEVECNESPIVISWR